MVYEMIARNRHERMLTEILACPDSIGISTNTLLLSDREVKMYLGGKLYVEPDIRFFGVHEYFFECKGTDSVQTRTKGFDQVRRTWDIVRPINPGARIGLVLPTTKYYTGLDHLVIDYYDCHMRLISQFWSGE